MPKRFAMSVCCLPQYFHGRLLGVGVDEAGDPSLPLTKISRPSPVIVWKGKVRGRVHREVKAFQGQGKGYNFIHTVSAHGKTTRDTMKEALHGTLKPFTKLPTPRLYLVDGAPSHMVPKVCDILTQLGWGLYVSPHNSTASAQPMDQSQINQRFKAEVEHNFAMWVAEEEKLGPKECVPGPPRWLIGKWVREAYKKITDTISCRLARWHTSLRG